MHMNAVWQSLHVCATKNFCALPTFTENLYPWLRPIPLNLPNFSRLPLGTLEKLNLLLQHVFTFFTFSNVYSESSYKNGLRM